MSSPLHHTLIRHTEPLAVTRLGPGTDVPSWAHSGTILNITATRSETSIVSAYGPVPKKAKPAGPFTAFEVQGPLDLALTGVLASLIEPLADAEISVFTISTFETDWILVPIGKADAAQEVWRGAGYEITDPSDGDSTGADS